MNKRNSFVILALSASFLLAACGEGESSSSAATTSETSVTSIESSPILGVHTVTFETNGGSSIAPVTVADGDKVARPADPVKVGATFVDWYEDEACVTVFDFDTAIHADITLFAEWDEDTSSESESLEPEGNYIYFKDASWWNNMAASTNVSFEEIDPTTATEFGELMTWIVYDKVGQFNYWCVEVPEEATGLMFIRTYTDPDTQELKYGGSCTSFLELPTDGSDMYVLDGTEWTTEAAGHWEVYEGEDPSASSVDPDESSEPSGEEVTYEVTGIPTWITNDGCIIFAWAWADGEGAWYSCEYTAFEEEHATALEFTTPTEMKGLLLVRCVAGTETPDWSIKTGDAAGRIYNQTSDIAVTAGVHTFEAPESIWKEYK